MRRALAPFSKLESSNHTQSSADFITNTSGFSFRYTQGILASPFKAKSRLEAENAALRQQLIVLWRKVKSRPRLANTDRWFFVQLYRWFPSILDVHHHPSG